LFNLRRDATLSLPICMNLWNAEIREKPERKHEVRTYPNYVRACFRPAGRGFRPGTCRIETVARRGAIRHPFKPALSSAEDRRKTGAMARKPIDERIRQAQARLDDLKARASANRRAAETRRKIVLGAAVELAMEDDPELRSQVIGILRQKVTRDIDKEAVSRWLSTT
jgi:hypothetical protein